MTTSTSTNLHIWSDLRTGVLFLIGMVLVGSLALIISKNTGIGQHHNTIRFFTADTRGLAEGNPVSVAGKKIGRVAGMEISRSGDTTGVMVILEIESPYFELLRSDSRAVIKGLGMLGDKYIDIAVGVSGRRLKEGGMIVAMAERGMEDLTANAISTTASVNELLDVALRLARRIDRGDGSIGKLLSSTELSDGLIGSVANLRALTGRLSGGKGLAWRLLEDSGPAIQFDTTMHHLDEALAAVSDLAGSIRDGNGTLGKLLGDEELYDQLLTVARRADSLVSHLDRGTAVLDGFSVTSDLYQHVNRSICSLDSLFIDMKRRPERYIHFSVFK